MAKSFSLAWGRAGTAVRDDLFSSVLRLCSRRPTPLSGVVLTDVLSSTHQRRQRATCTRTADPRTVGERLKSLLPIRRGLLELRVGNVALRCRCERRRRFLGGRCRALVAAGRRRAPGQGLVPVLLLVARGPVAFATRGLGGRRSFGRRRRAAAAHEERRSETSLFEPASAQRHRFPPSCSRLWSMTRAWIFIACSKASSARSVAFAASASCPFSFRVFARRSSTRPRTSKR